ncbi:hypothetical protein AX16_009873 [Volvariella volvacea WC 439]|nr:hypothetical protein AX16_009873 [Volvariella volvacea WC 439]
MTTSSSTTTLLSTILVTALPSKATNGPQTQHQRPAHWLDKRGTAFQNPWPSWRDMNFSDSFYLLTQLPKFPSRPKDASHIVSTRFPTWGAQFRHSATANNSLPVEHVKHQPDTKDQEAKEGKDRTIATWLGHACFLVEFPTRSEGVSRGVRVLFDPVFSDRCSPSQWVGPKRFTQPPCKIEELPEVDAVVISHNHYDHLDTHTIRTIFKHQSRPPHFFAPLGNGPWFDSVGIPKSHTHIMDWWDTKRIEVAVPGKENGDGEEQKVAIDLTCTPAQHMTGRGIHDRFKTLWASWSAVEVVPEPQAASGVTPTKVFFGGDTGYRAVMDHENEDEVPTCPVFKEIGEKFGGFDLALIPIGAYQPRRFMSPFHCAPQDSVRLFQDIRAKRALGMHWGTWVLTSEEVTEPPKRLAQECEKLGIEAGRFTTCEIGESLWF